MYDESSVYPKIESGYVFEHHMNKAIVDDFNNQYFNQDVNDSAILETKC